MFSYCSEWRYPLPKDHAEVIFLACVLLIKAISVSSPLSKSLIEGLLTLVDTIYCHFTGEAENTEKPAMTKVHVSGTESSSPVKPGILINWGEPERAPHKWYSIAPIVYSYMFVWYVGHVRNVCQIYALHCTIGISAKYSIAHALLGHRLKFTTLSHDCLL